MLRWDGITGEVEHDGWFDLIIRRTYVPGWWAFVERGPETRSYPSRADCNPFGFQGQE